jgi:hypothetical protein
MLVDAEHNEEDTACLKGYGYCDPSRLTLEETRAIHQPIDSSEGLEEVFSLSL